MDRLALYKLKQDNDKLYPLLFEVDYYKDLEKLFYIMYVQDA
jgi:hypothetical protein